MKKTSIPLFEKQIILEALLSSLCMLDPRVQIKNPVMFSTYLGASFISLTLLLAGRGLAFYFELQIALWLWFTIFFANFAEALAECRGKAHAASLRRTKTESFAKKWDGKQETRIEASRLMSGDIILAEAGDMILADGDVIEGVATVDESAITGESAPVIRESGGDRSAVTAGTRVLSDRILIQVTSEPGKSFLDKMIQLVEGAKRQKTPNEIALNILLSSLTILFLIATVSAKLFFYFSASHFDSGQEDHLTMPILVALFVCLIPTTISALINAIGIAGLFRLIEKNVIAKSGRSVEAAGDIDLLILDKTGTITIGNRMATSFIPVSGVSKRQFAEIALLASLSDETPEGRSIVILAKKKFELSPPAFEQNKIKIIPFSAKSRISGIDFLDNAKETVRSLRKGAVDAIKHMAKDIPPELETQILAIAKSGGTPIVVAENNKVVGIIELKDIVKGGIRDRFIALRKMGIRTVMVTGDNPLTAAAIAAEAGVDDYVAEATPEMKLDLIKREQAKGRLVAMTGDGTNDAPALAQADVAVAMNTGTQASREAGNMVDLDSNPTKLLDVVEIGKQLLMTRGALTTFSIANDVAKYFAILPAIFSSLYLFGKEEGPLSVLNIMSLGSSESAILSAVIFNALIILALIPLALKGVTYKPGPASQLLKRNLYLYGLGGIITPFIGIKVIDLFLIHFGVV